MRAGKDGLRRHLLLGHEVEAHPVLAREIVRRGHSIGDHTWDHPEFTKLSHDRGLELTRVCDSR